MIKEVSDKLEEVDVVEPLIMCENQYLRLYFPGVKIPKKCRSCSSDEINPNCRDYKIKEVYDLGRQKFLSLSQFALR